eukprot:389023_1
MQDEFFKFNPQVFHNVPKFWLTLIYGEETNIDLNRPCFCRAQPCYHSISNNLYGFKECIESLSALEVINYDKQCIHINYQTKDELFSNLLCKETKKTEQKYIIHLLFKHSFCGNCINYLLTSYSESLLSIFRSLKPSSFTDGEGISILTILFIQCFISPTFRNIVLSDFVLFAFACHLWCNITMNIQQLQQHTDDLSLYLRHTLWEPFIIRFYLNVRHWNKRNLFYFNFCHLRDLTMIINKTMLLCRSGRIKLRESNLIFIIKMRVEIVCQYFKKFKKKQSASNWISNGMTKRKYIHVMSDFHRGVRTCLKFDIKTLDKEHRENMKCLRNKASTFLKKIHLKCYECDRSPKERHIQKFKLCSECAMVYFCDRNCQKKSWNVSHRYQCKQLKAIRLKFAEQRVNDLFTRPLACFTKQVYNSQIS